MDPSVVIVHDYLGQFGGAERVVEVMCETFGAAPVYTSYYSPDRTYDYFRTVDVRTSFLQHAPWIGSRHKAYLALYPLAFASLRLPPSDVVLSSSTAFAKGVRVPEGATHVCYCNTPMRFAWDFERYVAHDSDIGAAARVAARMVAPYLRRLDLRTNAGVDVFVANSENIRRRIERLYGRSAVVIYPPVDVGRFVPSSETEDYYLVLSRLVGYKRVDLAVEACSRTGRKLLVVGEGPEREDLEARAGGTVEFLGRLSDPETLDVLARCRALLFCGDEDFGITPVEAMASGRPVIAYGAGGALETVVDGVTGVFFDEQSPESLIEAMDRFEDLRFAPDACVEQAQRFGTERFEREIRDLVRAAHEGWRSGESEPRAGEAAANV